MCNNAKYFLLVAHLFCHIHLFTKTHAYVDTSLIRFVQNVALLNFVSFSMSEAISVFYFNYKSISATWVCKYDERLWLVLRRHQPRFLKVKIGCSTMHLTQSMNHMNFIVTDSGQNAFVETTGCSLQTYRCLKIKFYVAFNLIQTCTKTISIR